MDDERKALIARIAVIVGVTAVAVLVGVQVAGDRVVTPLLLGGLLAMAYLAYGTLPVRSASRAPAPVNVPRQRAPEWYSERWVQENVQRGLRSLEEWRREQPSR